MTHKYLAPRLLAADYNTDTFTCRSVEHTQWLRRRARQANASKSARVLVVTEAGKGDVVAYYAWAMASIHPTKAPARLTKGAGRYPQPVAWLARLGVSVEHEGRGLGAALLRDVISRSVEVSHEIGCRGLVVHAESQQARDSYLHLVPEFEPSPTDALHLVLMMKDIVKTLR